MEEPSQAERLQTVAAAGIGASDKDNMPGDPLSPRAAIGSNGATSESSDAAMEEAEAERKSSSQPEAPQRSAAKIGLIMFSLCVSECLESGRLDECVC